MHFAQKTQSEIWHWQNFRRKLFLPPSLWRKPSPIILQYRHPTSLDFLKPKTNRHLRGNAVIAS